MWFKIIGVLIGYHFFGIFGALMGYIVGGIVDRYIAFGSGAVNPFTNAQRQAVFIDAVFMLMGKIAKADGHISQDEIAHVEDFMQKLRMSSEHRERAIALFRQGATPDFDLEPKLNEFITVCGRTHNLKQMLLVYLIVMALSDGRMDAAEESLLKEIALRLGYDRLAFSKLLEMVLNRSHFAGGQVSSVDALDEAYKALGVKKESSDQEIKRAYRKLISQYHPDKLMGQGVPEDMIAVATAQTQEVQTAYDLIKKSRNI
ncbi:MAG: co-chaperone DjlA [Nitrosospira sp.]